MQWKNPDGSITDGAVIEDGAGNKLGTAANPLNVTGGGGGGGSNASVGSTGASVPASATAAGFKNPAGNLVIPALTASGGVQVDGSGVTQPISAVALPLPAGAATAANQASFATTAAGNASRQVVADPSSGVGALVQPFHNADNQAIPAASNGLMTGGVAQLVNASANLNRQRETGFDGVPAAGVAAGAQQLAGPPLTTTMTSGAISALATPQTVTLAQTGLTWINRGVSSTVQVGTEFLVDAGLSTQEIVFVSALNAGARTIAAVFSKAHSTGATFLTFAYNQARDATISDGASPAGIAASAAYFYNATSQTVEMERSAAGEQDGANGVGTAVAAEYEYNGGGPLSNAGAVSGLAFDRARNLQGKGAGGSTLNGAVAAGAMSVTLNAAVGLTPGAQIRFDRAVGTEECGYVSQSYVPGTLTVALQSALAYAHASIGTVDWDVFAASGPGLNGFTAAGIGIGEEALYDPVSDKYYIERAATQDGVSPQNVVLEAPGLWNGATYDRWREGTTIGAGLVQPVDNATGSATVSATGVLTGFPLNTAGYGKLYVFIAANASFQGSIIWEASNDGFVTVVPVYASNLSVNQLGYSSSTGAANPPVGQLYEVPLTHAAIRLRCNVFTSGSLTVQWNAKNPGGLFKQQVDQASSGSIGASWWTRVSDGTNGPAAVKPASTPAVASDPALVVALSPNSPLPEVFPGIAGVASDIGGTVTFNANGQTSTPVSTRGHGSMLVVCTSATNTGTTVTWEGSDDNWTTYYSIVASRLDSNVTAAASSIASPAAGNMWDVPTKFAQVRLRCTAYTTNPTTFQWALNIAGPARVIVDQGAGNISTSWLVNSTAKSTYQGGLPSSLAIVGAASNNLTTVKSTAGHLYMADFCNNGASWVYLKLFNGAPTMGTTAALVQYGIPPGGSKTIGFADIGLAFSTGIYAAITAGIALTDNTSTAANTVTGTFHYA
jgi:hypothetical protein